VDGAGLPAALLLYIAGATTVTNILVNGVRSAYPLPALASFLGACALGIVFVLLFMIANSVALTWALGAGAIIAGVMVGGASAGVNAVHNKVKPAETPDAERTPPAWLPPAPGGV
jgi:hypothetical protein